jgi:PAS domain S-box-containing protein
MDSPTAQPDDQAQGHMALLQTFITQMPFAVAMFDRRMHYLAVSDRWRADFRLGDQPLIGRSHYDIFPEISDAWKAIHRRCLAGETITNDGEPFYRADGTVDWIRWKVTPWFRRNGEIGGLIIYSEDISDRKRGEEALRASESRYRELVQNANSAIIRWRADGTIVFFNEFAERFFGYRAAEVLGKAVSILVPAQESTGANLTRLVADIVAHPDQFVNTINENVRRDGSRVWMAWTNHPLFDEHGQLVEILAVGSDITALKHAEAERERLLNEVERRAAELTATFASIADGVAIFDATGTLRYANPTADRIFKQTPEERAIFNMALLRVLPLTHPDGSRFSEADSPVHRALRGEANVGTVMVFHRPDGDVWVTASAAPILTDEGEMLGAVGSFTDITALHALQERERRYVTTLAHNLRAPATLIRGNLELLIDQLRGTEYALLPQVHALQRALQRMSLMVDDFYLVTRLEEGTLPLAPEPVVLPIALPVLLAQSAPVVDMARIRVEVPADLPPVRADRTALQTILLHLLENAQKFSPPDAPVRLTAHPVADGVEIAVVDQGVGLAPAELDELFTRFFRVGHAHRAEGTGLGLYIVKRLVEAQGGRVRVESTPGAGSTFAFTLPTA